MAPIVAPSPAPMTIRLEELAWPVLLCLSR